MNKQEAKTIAIEICNLISNHGHNNSNVFAIQVYCTNLLKCTSQLKIHNFDTIEISYTLNKEVEFSVNSTAEEREDYLHAISLIIGSAQSLLRILNELEIDEEE